MRHVRTRARNALAVAAACALLALLPAVPAGAHELTRGVGTQTFFRFGADSIELELNFGVSASAAYPFLTSADKNLDERVDLPEVEEFLRTQGPRLVKDLALRVNGRRLQFELLQCWNIGMVGKVMPIPFDCHFLLRATLPPPLPRGGWWIHYEDETHKKEFSSQVCWVRDSGHHPELSYRIIADRPPEEIPGAGFQLYGRRLEVLIDTAFNDQFVTEKLTAPPVDELAAVDLGPGWKATELATRFAERAILGDRPPLFARPGVPSAAPAQTPSRATEEDEETERLAGIIEKFRADDIPWLELLPLILLAIVLGAGHALGPGHGKAMVSAYLVGTQGRVRDAVILGVVVTFSHTFSVFLLGLGLAWGMQRAIETSGELARTDTYQNWLITSFSFLSGLMLAALGVTLTLARWRALRNLDGQGHDHHHHHQPPTARAGDGAAVDAGAPGRTRLRDLIVLGVSGGIVPCPAGLTIMLVAAHQQALWEALVLFFFFSLGLGGLLVGIGVLLVLGKDSLFARSHLERARRDRIAARLAVASAVMIGLLGVYFTGEAIYRDPTSFMQMAASAREWWGK